MSLGNRDTDRFGAIRGLENPQGMIKWPRSERDMTMWGMQEAHREAILLEVAPKLKIRVVTLPCLVVLKLFAWLDRRHSDKGQGDLADVNFILSHYDKLSKSEQISWDAFARATEIAESLGRVDQLDFTEHVGASSIGSELGKVLHPQTKFHLREILSPLAENAYHPSIQHLIPLFDTEQRYREIVSLRFALLLQCLSI